MLASLALCSLILCLSAKPAPKIPTVKLYNAAVPGTEMPVIGIGTGSYGKGSGKSNISYTEVWNYTAAYNVSQNWYSVGGTRWDSAIDYNYVTGAAAGLLDATGNWTLAKRSDFFITSKTGPGRPLGYDDSIKEWEEVTSVWNTTYIDLLLIHWPFQNASTSSDNVCDGMSSEYDIKLCVQATWKAYEYIFTELKGAKAIGVSNFEQVHIEYIMELQSLIPSVDQIEFHGYWHQYDLVNFCNDHKIQVNGYAPLGTPDLEYGNWIGQTPILINHTLAINIGKKYNKTAAQIWLRWQLQQGLVINPRTWDIEHMKENLDVFDFEIIQEDMLDLASIAVPKDPKVCGFPNM